MRIVTQSLWDGVVVRVSALLPSVLRSLKIIIEVFYSCCKCYCYFFLLLLMDTLGAADESAHFAVNGTDAAVNGVSFFC